MQECDGWELHKKTRFNQSPVKRYQALVQEDYTRNKILVCANLSNLWHSYQTSKLFNPHTMQMRATSRHLDNYFNLDKWNLLNDTSPADDCATDLAPERESPQKNILTKSQSTAHIHSLQKTKTTRRVYGCFDTDTAIRMFGYRINFRRSK